MERTEISSHEVKVYLALKSQPGKWLSNAEIAKLAGGMNLRTVRMHTLRLVKLGIVDQAEIFPAYRYRLASKKADKRNAAYSIRLNETAEVMGLS
jgi:hypothetical protein